MDKFIEKMEALLSSGKIVSFKIVLTIITLIGVLLFISWFIFPFISENFLIEYVRIGGLILLTCGILWITTLGIEKEEKSNLEDFLEDWGDKPFTRHDFAKFLYGKAIEAKDHKYKGLGRILRKSIGTLIEVTGRESSKIVYKIIGQKNKQKNTKKRNSKKGNEKGSDK